MAPTWRGDGIIARIETRAIARRVARTGLPVVDVSAGRHIRSIRGSKPTTRRSRSTRRIICWSAGFRNLAYCGESRFNWSRWRSKHFHKLALAAGATVDIYESSGTRPVDDGAQRPARLGEQLPKPAGIMACYDIKAQQLLDVCRENGLAVPEEIA